MANEITVVNSLQVRVLDADNQVIVDYRGQPQSFRADMAGAFGPAVGVKTIQATYTPIDLSELGTPGFCRFSNQDQTNYVEIGVYYQAGGVFIPVFELLPGESSVVRLSRYLGTSQDAGTGTGTANTAPVYLAAKSTGGTSLKLLVEAFPQ